MSLEIRDPLKKYVRLTPDGEKISRFICPVEGCGFATKLGPGALRMHLLIKADPNSGSRYCSNHEEFCTTHERELGLDIVRYLHNLPKVPMET
ncbi:MAG: hypothetical protein PVJ38_03490 [Candidatus Bathyarchaeota archaeon]